MKDQTKIRKVIDLHLTTVERLKVLAENESRSVKNYVERLIKAHAENPNKPVKP